MTLNGVNGTAGANVPYCCANDQLFAKVKRKHMLRRFITEVCMWKKRVVNIVALAMMMVFASVSVVEIEANEGAAEVSTEASTETSTEASSEAENVEVEPESGENDSEESSGNAGNDSALSEKGSGNAGNDSGLAEAMFCSFVIPNDFEVSEFSGVFTNKSYPMESSTIQYSYFDNGMGTPLTNRERLERQEQGISPEAERSTELTKDIYEETLAAAYNSEYGEDVGYSVSSFSDIIIDGYPGYKIEANFKQSGQETVYQTVYMLLSKYRTFTVTFQRAEDDDCEELFEKCASTIHVR